MWRLPITVCVLLWSLIGPSFALCSGQKPTQKVIYEDTFADDKGGWTLGRDNMVIKSGTLIATIHPGFRSFTTTNTTFSASDGDYCMRFIFPPPEPGNEAAVSLMFWAPNLENYYSLDAYYGGYVALGHLADHQFTSVFSVDRGAGITTGPDDINELRIVAKGNLLTAYVNGKEIRSVRAQQPDGGKNFGFYAEVQRQPKSDTNFRVKYYNVLQPQ